MLCRAVDIKGLRAANTYSSHETIPSMKYLLMLLAAALAQAEEPISLHYHETVGIPQAARLKQAELATDFDGSRIIGGAAAAVGTYPFLVYLSTVAISNSV